MAGLLKIIATPIGNLGDMSPRAAQALKDCSVILTENKRHSRKLFASIALDLKPIQLISCSAPEESKCIPIILKHLQQGKIIGLISDAGAPAISDPGGRLIQAVIQAGFKIEVIPGPSAVITALMGSGLITHRFAFLGFLPKKGKERVQLIQDSLRAHLALVLFESPNRIQKTLNELFKLCGPQKLVVARELTKHFETFHRGILGQNLEPQLVEKGELVLIVEAGNSQPVTPVLKTLSLGSKARAKQLAAQQGISVRQAYQKLIGAT